MICVDCRHLDSYALCQLLRKWKCLICVSILYQCLDRGKLIFIIVHFSSLTLIDFFPVLIICNTIFWFCSVSTAIFILSSFSMVFCMNSIRIRLIATSPTERNKNTFCISSFSDLPHIEDLGIPLHSIHCLLALSILSLLSISHKNHSWQEAERASSKGNKGESFKFQNYAQPNFSDF